MSERRAEQGEPGSPEAEAAPATAPGVEGAEGAETEGEEVAVAPLPGTAPAAGEVDDLERLLAEEEEIERRTSQAHHETPHFRKETD